MTKLLNNKKSPVYLLHMPGKGTLDACSELINMHLARSIKVDKDITVIVVATKNYITTSPVIQQLERNNISYLNGAEEVLEENWDNTLKIDYILKNLKKIKTKYTLILDSRDTLICNDLDESFIKKFKSFKSKIVFNSSVYRHPSWLVIDGIDNKYKASLKSKPFLNSGICLGETEYLFRLYAKANTLRMLYHYNELCSDQFLIKLILASMPYKKWFKIDNKDLLFKCIHQSINKPDFEVINFKNNYIIKNILSKKYNGKRFKKYIKLSILNKTVNLILYPNCKNHENDVKNFIDYCKNWY